MEKIIEQILYFTLQSFATLTTNNFHQNRTFTVQQKITKDKKYFKYKIYLIKLKGLSKIVHEIDAKLNI